VISSFFHVFTEIKKTFLPVRAEVGGGMERGERKRERELVAGRFGMFLPYAKSAYFMLR
jgi:hypothetical protein